MAAGVLLCLGGLLALALFSHDPADAPGNTVHPANERPTNLLGSLGAWLSHHLLDSLGAAVYALLAAWFVLVVFLLLRRDWLRWSRRLCGWVLLVPVVAMVADHLNQSQGTEGSVWTPRHGAGGSLGAWINWKLGESLSDGGRVALTLVLLLVTLALTLDSLVLVLIRKLWKRTTTPRPAARVERPLPAKRVPAPADEEDEEEEEETLEQEEEEEAASTGIVEAEEPATARVIPIRHHDQMPESLRDYFKPKEATRRPVVVHASGPLADIEVPPLSLLEDSEPFPHDEHDKILQERGVLLEKVFADFDIRVQVVGINTGPVITQFELALEKGMRVQKVTRLADDIALNLRVPSVRIVAPIPGKDTVGVETPNEHRAVVRLKEVIQSGGKKVEQSKLPLFLGKDASGRPLIQDLAAMPHLLIAGSTGTGKSVCLNAIILSLLMTRRPSEVRMVMIDPKMVELIEYSKLPHLMHPVVTEMKKAEAILAWAVDKMEERYDLLGRARVRNIAGYNELGHAEVLNRVKPDDDERERIPAHMPYIVIFLDEVGDLIMQYRKEVEGHIIRLSQKSRAAGIHLVLATQRPTVDVITGLIKSNLPSRICFKVSNKSDSRVVLDEMGADKLLGKGDMLFLPPGTSSIVRAQCTYASDQEIGRVVADLECDEPYYEEELMRLPTAGSGVGSLDKMNERDELYHAAVDVVVREQRGSVSLLQRVLGIGYGRASRLIDFMAEDGIVGTYNGSNAREVKYKPEEWDEMKRAASAG